jgi:probable phosphoglycerate mutase
MSTLEVCLVRHGQSVSNAAGVWQGQGDSPLNELGRTQVEGLRRALREQRYDLVLSSDLSRAADTAKASGVEVEHDRAWREIHVGDWEGLTMEQVVERFPEQIEALKARQSFAIGGGESWPEVFERADASLAKLRQRLPRGGRAIVFTHGGIIAALLSGLLGVRNRFPWPLGRMRNTGRTTLRFSGERVELVSHNDDTHIPAEPIKSARKTGAGGAVSVSGTSHQIANLAQQTADASVNEFQFVAPEEGRSSELLISESHRMLLDYGLPIIQI